MPVSTKPTELAQALRVERRIFALWHREEPPSRTVVEKFSRKLGRYPQDRQQRLLQRLGFETQAVAGSWAMPDPLQDSEGADVYLRQALGNVHDVVVFYSDLLGSDDDPVGRRTGRELEFFCDPLMHQQLRFWFGRVHDIDTAIGQIGRCALNAIPWTFLPGGAAKFTLKDPDGALDSEVAVSIQALLGEAQAAASAAPAAPPAAATQPQPPAGGWLQRLWPFGHRP